MAIIATRSPFWVSQNTNSLTVKIYIYDIGGTVPGAPQYEIVRKSIDGVTPEELSVNVSPFLDGYIRAVAPVASAAPTPISSDQFVAVRIDVNGLLTDYTAALAVYPSSSTSQYNYTETVKNWSPLGFQLITFPDADVSGVRYTTNLGATKTAISNPSTVGVSTINVAPPISIGDATSFKVEVLHASGTVTYNYEVACVWDDAYTIGFINKYGWWEYFDCIGSIQPAYNSKRSEYISWATGQRKAYNQNYKENFIVNTGWVDQNFRKVIEDLMISPSIVLFVGEGNYPLMLMDQTIKRQLQRNEKMMNYSLNFELLASGIPIATGKGVQTTGYDFNIR
jgi:hypothetical protein